MKFIKLAIFFIISFLASYIILRTFSQPVFKVKASAEILGYTTPPVAVYYYIGGSFLVGLFIGLSVAVYYLITLSAKSLKKTKQIQALEKEVHSLHEYTSKQEKESQKSVEKDEISGKTSHTVPHNAQADKKNVNSYEIIEEPQDIDLEDYRDNHKY